eukprot:4730336-Prymnesium_polylepis.1
MAAGRGIRRELNAQQAAAAAGLASGSSSSSGNVYMLAAQLQVWMLVTEGGDAHIMLNPAPTEAWVQAAWSNGWVSQSFTVAFTFDELQA